MFQFRNGSIKRSFADLQPYWEKSFNSEMVRLKDELLFIQEVLDQQFQFRNGSIKSLFRFSESGVCWEFQFRNGSIKSFR